MGESAIMSTVTLQVWYALKRPPIHHPLFRRISRIRQPAPATRISTRRRILLTAILLGVFYISLRFYAQLLFVVLFFIPIGVAALYMALHGTIAGLYWAIRVSGAIARERERGVFELLSTSPYGAFSASWAICTGCQYYDQTFNGAGAQRVWFSRVFFLTLLFLSALISLADPRNFGGASVEGFVYILAIVSILAFAFYIDDIHSLVLGSLVGVIVPMFARNRLDARIGALTGFLLLQIGTYLIVFLFGYILIPQVHQRLLVTGFAAEIALPLELLLIFFSVRELIARLLWRLNSLLLDGDVSDLRLLTKGGRLIC
jgi:hypothetical protein